MKLFMKTCAAVIFLLSAVPVSAYAASTVVDFENGDYSAFYMKEKDGDPSLLSVVEYNGSKALFIDTQENGTPKVIIDVKKLVGEDQLEQVRTISMDLVIVQPDGDVPGWNGGAVGSSQGENAQLWYQGTEWIIEEYINNATPVTTISTTFEDGYGFLNHTEAYYLFMNWSHNGTDMYIDNVTFYDGEGNAIPVLTESSEETFPETGVVSMAVPYVMCAILMGIGAIAMQFRRKNWIG